MMNTLVVDSGPPPDRKNSLPIRLYTHFSIIFSKIDQLIINYQLSNYQLIN